MLARRSDNCGTTGASNFDNSVLVFSKSHFSPLSFVSYIRHLKFCKLSLYAEDRALRLDFNCSRKPSLIFSRLKYSRTGDLGLAGPRAILSKMSPRIQGTSSFKTSIATVMFSHFLTALFCDVKV